MFNFDGAAKTITPTPDETAIVTKDLYSRWKDWARDSDNAKYLQGMSSIGGDPTVPGQTAPAYYFMKNGWKVVIDGFDTSFSFNLYADDGSSPVVTQNGGTAQLFNSDVGIVESTVEQGLDYNGKVWIDFANGTASNTYPTGTAGQPVNNFIDALALSVTYGLKDLYIINGVATLAVDVSNYVIEGASPLHCGVILDPSTGVFTNAKFLGISVNGTSREQDPLHLERCAIGDLNLMLGLILQCGLGGTVSLSTLGDTAIWDCVSMVPGSGSPTLDMRVGVPTGINLRGYSGGLRVINCDHPDDIGTLEYVAGRCKLDPSCTNGFLSVRGNCDLQDNTLGTTVDTSPHIQSLVQSIGSVGPGSSDALTLKQFIALKD